MSRPNAGWLVSPAFDLLFVANLGWLLLLVPGVATETDTPVTFWQVYFVTLPHRWLTLVLVVLDPDRRGDRAPRLVGTALVALLLVAGVRLGTGGLTCLAIVDFVWNSWHFGAQHAGVLRMYSLKAGAGPSLVERWGLRLFVAYALLRSAAWTTGWTLGDAALEQARLVADLVALALPIAVILAVLTNGRATPGRLAYLASVAALYAALLGSLMVSASPFVLPLLTASALFHAAEYLAIVSLYASRRQTVGSAGPFRALGRAWPSFLLLYVVALGALGLALEGAGPFWAELWLAINVWAALVHYAFDGMIWKLRAPATAMALGANAKGAP